MARFLKDEDKIRQQSVSFTKEMRDKIIVLAKEEKRSFSGMVNYMLGAYLEGLEEHDVFD